MLTVLLGATTGLCIRENCGSSIYNGSLTRCAAVRRVQLLCISSLIFSLKKEGRLCGDGEDILSYVTDLVFIVTM